MLQKNKLLTKAGGGGLGEGGIRALPDSLVLGLTISDGNPGHGTPLYIHHVM